MITAEVRVPAYTACMITTKSVAVIMHAVYGSNRTSVVIMHAVYAGYRPRASTACVTLSSIDVTGVSDATHGSPPK